MHVWNSQTIKKWSVIWNKVGVSHYLSFFAFFPCQTLILNHVCLCICVWIWACECRCLMRLEVSDPLDPGASWQFTHMYMNTHSNTHVYTCTNTCTIHTHALVCTYVHTLSQCAHMHTHICVHAYVYMCCDTQDAHTLTHVRTFTHVYTQMHTHTPCTHMHTITHVYTCAHTHTLHSDCPHTSLPSLISLLLSIPFPLPCKCLSHIQIFDLWPTEFNPGSQCDHEFGATETSLREGGVNVCAQSVLILSTAAAQSLQREASLTNAERSRAFAYGVSTHPGRRLVLCWCFKNCNLEESWNITFSFSFLIFLSI